MATVVSSVKPADICATVPDTTGSICSKLKALWSLANKMCTMAEQFLNTDGSLSDDGKSFFSSVSVPVGSIVFWPMDMAPEGWLAANGDTISRTTYADLFAAYGTKYGAGDLTSTFTIPDLRRKFLFGSSGSNVSGSTGGAESATLTMGNLPSEPAPLGALVTRLLVVPSGAAVSDDITPTFGAVPSTVVARKNDHSDHDENVMGDLGNDTPVDILPPYFSGVWIIKF